MRYTTVIWDFNGTIIDDVQIGIDSVNEMLSKRGLQTIDGVDTYKKLFGFPVKDYYMRLGFDFSKEPYEELAVEWVRNYTVRENMIKLMAGFREVCDYFRTIGVSQVILSSSEKEMMLRQLDKFGIRDRFDVVIGSTNIYAGGKVEAAMRAFPSGTKQTVMIGDTIHDAETGQAIGAECILYDGGHGRRDELLSSGFPVISNMTDLLNIL